MEDTYNKYANEYDLNVDREQSLLQICKLNLKMDEALDIGDLNGYRQLAQAHDTLRKSAKFTDSQKDKDATRVVDSIGELVLLCEQEGDIIPRIPNPDDTPQDNVDFAIKDIKAYIYHLAVNELGMGDRIEKLVEEMRKQAEEESDELEDDFVLSADDEIQPTDEEEIEAEREFSDFFSSIEDSIDSLLEGDDL